MSGENLIGEFQKHMDRIEVCNVPLESTLFNQRKDKIAYKIITFYWGSIEEVISYVSSRDKRLLDQEMQETIISFESARKIEI